jgi:hypothetical protein
MHITSLSLHEAPNAADEIRSIVAGREASGNNVQHDAQAMPPRGYWLSLSMLLLCGFS